MNNSIASILETLDWLSYDWLLFLTTLEIEFNIEIPDRLGEDRELTLGELVTNFATLEVVQDKSWEFRKVMALGYLNLSTDDEGVNEVPDIIMS